MARAQTGGLQQNVATDPAGTVRRARGYTSVQGQQAQEEAQTLMRRGEIWLGNLNPNRGAEVGKIRSERVRSCPSSRVYLVGSAWSRDH
jgi:hypothetical protein